MKANKPEEKRAPRSYKCRQTHYVDARARAKKDGVDLAKMIEEIVIAYGEGAFSIHFKTVVKKQK